MRYVKLSFNVLSESAEELMPIVYTPTVGLAYQKFGLMFRSHKGLFITIHYKGQVYDVLNNWPEQDWGTLGTRERESPSGSCLSTWPSPASPPARRCPSPDYKGLRHERMTGAEYDEFIAAVAQRHHCDDKMNRNLLNITAFVRTGLSSTPGPSSPLRTES